MRSSINAIRMMELKRMRWARHGECMRKVNANIKGRNYIEDLGVDERIILKCNGRGVSWIHVTPITASCGLLWAQQWTR
jgi:hypothetical protein